ncbi:MAG: HK97 family phage prohead protease [Prevotellaceae bacterium]|jgi:HK97 family phage prohead protease|nr:HK97 family phage prohead protease [Prevotellaceae bacterium]
MGKTFILSDGASQNSYGFRIELGGLSLDRFESNPVMLFNHKGENIIGCWSNTRVEDNKLLAEAGFDMEDSLGKEISRKVEKGYLKGCSVGIRIKKMVETDQGLVATEAELLEASIVAVPSDAGAVVLYNENSEPTTLDVIKLNFFNKNSEKNMEKFELTAQTLTSLGLQNGATAEAVQQAVALKDAKIAELQTKVTGFEKEKVTTLIDQAVSEKRIGADEKDTYTALAEKDYEGVKKILAKMQGVTPVAGKLNAKGVASKYEGKTWDELDKSGMLASLKAEDPETYKQLYDMKFKK